MKKDAFSLVELMVVIVIIGILATLSITLMLRSRITGNEAVAISSCKAIINACQSYYSVSLPHTYPATLAELGPGNNGPAYLDINLASGDRSSYLFTYQLTSPVSFVIYAAPKFPGRTGVRYFYCDETGRVTGKEGQQAGPDDASVS